MASFLSTLSLKVQYFVTQFLLTNFGLFWQILAAIPFSRKYVDRFVISTVAKQLQFPLAYSTGSAYTTLASFTDRSYYNRILPAKEPLAPLPDAKKVSELFIRPPGPVALDDWSSALFFSFAQWFVDMFLMTETSPSGIKQLSQNLVNLSTVYGDSIEVENVLRSKNGGRLKSQRIHDEEFPPYITAETKDILISKRLSELLTSGGDADVWKKLFAIGHVRMNIQPGSLIFAIIFFREHNRIADILIRENPSWDDERVFQTAKNICIVLVMKIAIEDYVVNHIAFKLKYPLKFHPEVLFNTTWYYNNQRIFIEFDHLYRWHSFVPTTIKIDDRDHPLIRDPRSNPSAPEQLLWNTDLFTRRENSLSSIISSYSKAPAARFGLFNTHPMLVDKVELPTIEGGRNAKLASYNDYRERFGLWRFKSIDEITTNRDLRSRLNELYGGNVDNVEYYVGLMAEDRGYGNSIFPPLLATIVGSEAFRGVFGNPLLSPQVYNADTFTATGLKIIENTTLKTLVNRNTKSNSIVSFDLTARSWW